MQMGHGSKDAAVYIFGQLVNGEKVLQPGDRLEIYQPLLLDPKMLRRLSAQPIK